MIIWTIESIFIIKLFECTNLASILLQTKSNLRKFDQHEYYSDTCLRSCAHNSTTSVPTKSILSRVLRVRVQEQREQASGTKAIFFDHLVGCTGRAGLQNQSHLLCSSAQVKATDQVFVEHLPGDATARFGDFFFLLLPNDLICGDRHCYHQQMLCRLAEIALVLLGMLLQRPTFYYILCMNP